MTDSLHNPYPRSPIPSSASYDSSSVSSATSPRPQGMYEGGLMGASPRPLSGHMGQHITLSPGLPLGQSSFHHGYSSAATSPSGLGIDSMASTASSSGTPGPVGQMSSANMQAQKRAYRQRRKDPSCDACRERKVKCDATETSSCSECSGRSVKCQFTKETNRRMSSIKQVQDLEKQIAQVKRENGQLRAMLSIREGGSQMEIDTDNGAPTSSEIPEIGSQPKKRQRASPPSLDLSRVRSNIHNFGRGIFKPPIQHRQSIQQQLNFRGPELPPKHIADHLIRSYHSSIHIMFPIVDWPTFSHEFEKLYQPGPSTIDSKPPIWTSLFFSILAVGVLFSSDPAIPRPYKGSEYLELSRSLLDPWSDVYTLDHARQAFLHSIFLYESNLKSAASHTLASAIRIAQDLNLHQHLEVRSKWTPETQQQESQKRVWWGIYIFDRQLALELGKPLLINDADCDVSLPHLQDDYYVSPVSSSGSLYLPLTPQNGISHSHSHSQRIPTSSSSNSSFFLPLIHLMRSVDPLLKMLKSHIGTAIPTTTLASFDSHILNCIPSFLQAQIRSSKHSPTSNTAVDAISLSPLSIFLSLRLQIHTHNLTPSLAPEIRRTALERCIEGAFEMASLLGRISSSSTSASSSLQNTATTSLCIHIFRSTLFLLYASHYEAALTCLRASASVGRMKEVNVGCGRYLEFFLDILMEKKRGVGRGMASSNVNINGRDLDTELLAYVLGGGGGEDWIWNIGDEREMGMGSPPSNFESGDGGHIQSQGKGQEKLEWGGWDRILYLVDGLVREQGSGSSGGIRGIESIGGYMPLPSPPRTASTGTSAYAGLGLGVGIGGVSGGGNGNKLPSPPRRDASERMSITNII